MGLSIDREKVIKGLNSCSGSGTCVNSCPYYDNCGNNYSCTSNLAKDALALLKDRGHGETFIVIDSKTGEEADTYEIALHEDWAKELCYCDMEGWAIEDDGTLLLVDECGRFAYADRERFKVKWE